MYIRVLTNKDSDLFQALRIEAVNNAPTSFGESIDEIVKKSKSDISYQLEAHGRGDFVLGAFDNDNQLIGTVGFYRALHAKLSHKGMLWGMYVSPEKRKQGVAGALITKAIEHVRNLPEILYITLYVTTSNGAAMQLYKSMGFQVFGVEKFSLNVNGVFHDEALMRFDLAKQLCIQPAQLNQIKALNE